MKLNKEFVPYELTIKIKELGFDEPCFGGWCHPFKDNPNPYLQLNQECEYDIEAPTFSQAFRFFREKYDMPSHIHTMWQYDWDNYSYQWHITENKKEWNCIEHFKTYEEAKLECLRKLISIVKDELGS